MKQFLFVLLVLGLAIPASADVYVYNLKASSTGLGYQSSSDVWRLIKDANAGFVILEEPTNFDSKVDLNVWVVSTWKGKDKKNYVMAASLGTLNFEDAWLTKKDVWTVTGADKTGRIILTGDEKELTLSSYKSSCNQCHSPSRGALEDYIAPSLSGYAIADTTDKDGNRILNTTTMSLKLNTKLSIATHPDIDLAEDAAKSIVDDLVNNAGYIDVTEP
jgi:hypothetical protein